MKFIYYTLNLSYFIKKQNNGEKKEKLILIYSLIRSNMIIIINKLLN